MNIGKARFRPPLTIYEIKHIISLCKNETPISDLSISLVSKLAGKIAKIENNGAVPSYEIVDPPPTVLENLGGTSIKGNSSKPFSKEQWWEVCYNKVEKYGKDSCTLDDIQGWEEWRYKEDLMSPDEVVIFEERIGL